LSVVDNDSDQLNESTEISRAWTGTPFPTLRRERLTSHHMLEQIEGDGPSAQIALDKDEMVIGRAPDAHIRLASKKASRQHLFLRLRGTDCVMVDNDSHNGVLLNGVNVHSAVLRDGDVIHVADSVFVYRED
jgi:predicted component of type VI protein secretion system